MERATQARRRSSAKNEARRTSGGHQSTGVRNAERDGKADPVNVTAAVTPFLFARAPRFARRFDVR